MLPCHRNSAELYFRQGGHSGHAPPQRVQRPSQQMNQTFVAIPPPSAHPFPVPEHALLNDNAAALDTDAAGGKIVVEWQGRAPTRPSMFAELAKVSAKARKEIEATEVPVELAELVESVEVAENHSRREILYTAMSWEQMEHQLTVHRT